MSQDDAAHQLPGLDMKPELECYTVIKRRLWIDLGLYLTQVLDPRVLDGVQVEVPPEAQLTPAQIASLLSRFPACWRERSILKGIRHEQPCWFRPSAIGAKPITHEHVTTSRSEALSGTAVVPGYTGADGVYTEATITLYELGLDEDRYDEQAVAVALAWALVHEYVHTVAYPEWFRNDRHLDVGAGDVVASRDFLLEGYRLLANLGRPISHYASAYWAGRIPDPREDPDPFHEALAEAATAEVLGFVVGPAMAGAGPALEHHPFGRYPELRGWIVNYLHAYPVVTR